jgi:aromatic ring hydroxylase
MRTGSEYLSSLDDGRVVHCGGERVDVATHPLTRGYARVVADFYDRHHDAEHQDVLTFLDGDGRRHSMTWFLPRSKEDGRRRRRYYEHWWRYFKGGIFTRLPCSQNTVGFTLIDDPEPWQEQSTLSNGRALAENIRRWWAHIRENDLSVSPMFIDLQIDRSSPQEQAKQPILRIVERNEDGVVVEGWKAIGTSTVFSNEMLVGVFWRPGTTAEQVVFAAVPVNWPGITHVTRPSNSRPDADPADHPLATLGDELDGMAYFDNVTIPWERVFHLGNIEHARLYPQRIFDWIHHETCTRQAVNAELIAGLALLVAEALGTSQAPVVTSQLADLIRFRETMQAFNIAAEETGFFTPGGLYKPNNIYVDFGRAHYLENIHNHVTTLLDLCGKGVVVYPTQRDLDDPEIGPRLAAALRGPGISAHDKQRIFKLIHERFLTEWGARSYMFEKLNGTPLHVVRFLTMQRVDYAVDGPLVKLAREACGLGSPDELARAAERESADYPMFRRQAAYIQRQDVDDEGGRAAVGEAPASVGR